MNDIFRRLCVQIEAFVKAKVYPTYNIDTIQVNVVTIFGGS